MTKHLGDFEYLILLAIVRLKPDAYGATIHQAIEERTHRSIAIGAVYTGLARLQRQGLISSSIGAPSPKRGGRRKKFYHLESAGAAALARSYGDYRRMIEGIEPELNTLLPRADRP
jgi:DNA-binding PadR family transcriptional regulator